MYQATAAAFIPLPTMEIRLAANTNRSAFLCKIVRMIYSKRSGARCANCAIEILHRRQA
jgi:hypothetical protein